MLSGRRLRHRELRNKGKLTRKFDTGEIGLLRKQVKSIRKDGVSPKLVLKKRTLQGYGEGYTKTILVKLLEFL